MPQELTPREFLDRREAGEDMTLLDVREDWEVKLAPVPTDTLHIPMGEISDRLAELSAKKKEIVVICRSGGRSAQVADYLERQGFEKVFNLSGGILAWSRVIDPRIPQY
jgi:rhodanese-related sulfurtransferase